MAPYLVVGVTTLLLLGAAVVDARRREIPDAFPVALLAWAVATRWAGWLPPAWGAAALGLGIGLTVGLLLFAVGAMGGGDGKLLAGLGAVVAYPGFLVVLVVTAIAGGGWALIGRIRGLREVVYGPAILVGYVGAVVLGLLWGRG